MLYALKTSQAEIAIGAGPNALARSLSDGAKYNVLHNQNELRHSLLAGAKYNLLRTQNELGPNYDRYRPKRVTPSSFRGGKM